MEYVLSVTEINRYIKEIMSRDLVLSNLIVRGEISNYKHHYSGHMYFTIKDESSLLKCVMFRTHNQNIRFKPENGMKVIVKGYVSVFERDGQYQLYAEDMQPDGLGSLHLAFEQLKNKLEKEGLFDRSYKKKLPLLPSAVAVVTSSTGAVIRDIINVMGRRFSNIHIKVFPVAVQGETAAKEVAKAIKKLNVFESADVIILARGGGSLEELWAFNEEIVARSIFESKIPVISAVGHETDYTIADFVADMRAPTPSAAAELVVPEKAALAQRVKHLQVRLINHVTGSVRNHRLKYDKLAQSTVFKQPYDAIYQGRMRLDIAGKYLHKALLASAGKHRAELRVLAGKLDELSPLKVLSRGYSIARLPDGRVVKAVGDVTRGDRLSIGVKDGAINCMVDGVEKEAR